MAIVYGDNYQKMYLDEPKQLGDAGKQHTKLRCLSDNATAAAADEVYIGQIPDEAIILSAEVVGSATTIALEDSDGNSIAIGDSVDPRKDLVAVPSAPLTGELILVKYLQA